MNRNIEIYDKATIRFDDSKYRRIIRMQYITPVYESVIKVTCDKQFDNSSEQPVINTLHCFSGNHLVNHITEHSDDIQYLYITSDVTIPLGKAREYTFTVLDKDNNPLFLANPIIATLTFEEEEI